MVDYRPVPEADQIPVLVEGQLRYTGRSLLAPVNRRAPLDSCWLSTLKACTM